MPWLIGIVVTRFGCPGKGNGSHRVWRGHPCLCLNGADRPFQYSPVPSDVKSYGTDIFHEQDVRGRLPTTPFFACNSVEETLPLILLA